MQDIVELRAMQLGMILFLVQGTNGKQKPQTFSSAERHVSLADKDHI